MRNVHPKNCHAPRPVNIYCESCLILRMMAANGIGENCPVQPLEPRKLTLGIEALVRDLLRETAAPCRMTISLNTI